MCFNVNFLLATSSFTIFHILFITCFTLRVSHHIYAYTRKRMTLFTSTSKTLFTYFWVWGEKQEKRTEENESNTLSTKSYDEVTNYILLSLSYICLCVNKKYLELRIRVIIIMKLNENIKQHIIFGLHYKYALRK